MNSDSDVYGGSNVGNGGVVFTEAIPSHGHDQSLRLDASAARIPPAQARTVVAYDLAAFAADKAREAAAARIARLETVDNRGAAFDCVQIGNGWTHDHYEGLFLLPARARDALPCVSLCFVQSRDGNTGADNPDALGGGPIDKHLIYEGLSRVAADAVMAGAKTAEGGRTFFSVWHPQLVALRESLGLPRHPAQIVVTGRGCVDLDRTLLFNVPDVPVYVIAAPAACERLEAAVSRYRQHRGRDP